MLHLAFEDSNMISAENRRLHKFAPCIRPRDCRHSRTAIETNSPSLFSLREQKPVRFMPRPICCGEDGYGRSSRELLDSAPSHRPNDRGTPYGALQDCSSIRRPDISSHLAGGLPDGLVRTTPDPIASGGVSVGQAS